MTEWMVAPGFLCRMLPYIMGLARQPQAPARHWLSLCFNMLLVVELYSCWKRRSDKTARYLRYFFIKQLRYAASDGRFSCRFQRFYPQGTPDIVNQVVFAEVGSKFYGRAVLFHWLVILKKEKYVHLNY
jgi:hypothetical protein